MARTRKTVGTRGSTPGRPPWVLAVLDPNGPEGFKVAKAVNYLDLKPGTVVQLDQLRDLQNGGVNVTVQLCDFETTKGKEHPE